MLKIWLSVLLVFLFATAPSASASGEDGLPSPGRKLQWTLLENGLEMALLSADADGNTIGIPSFVAVRVLRISPFFFDFHIYSSSWEGHEPLTLEDWAIRNDLCAVINAGMFQKDGKTATGYMRSGKNINNPRIASRYGSFFVCEPLFTEIPSAAIIDKRREDWQDVLPRYGAVVQNFRLMDEAGTMLWPKNGPAHSISSIAQDADGNILFMHCRQPLSAHDFVRLIMLYPELHILKSMYMEGGKEAGLLLRLNGEAKAWLGFNPAGYFFARQDGPQKIPNVIGVRRRSP